MVKKVKKVIHYNNSQNKGISTQDPVVIHIMSLLRSIGQEVDIRTNVINGTVLTTRSLLELMFEKKVITEEEFNNKVKEIVSREEDNVKSTDVQDLSVHEKTSETSSS